MTITFICKLTAKYTQRVTTSFDIFFYFEGGDNFNRYGNDKVL